MLNPKVDNPSEPELLIVCRSSTVGALLGMWFADGNRVVAKIIWATIRFCPYSVFYPNPVSAYFCQYPVLVLFLSVVTQILGVPSQCIYGTVGGFISFLGGVGCNHVFR